MEGTVSRRTGIAFDQSFSETPLRASKSQSESSMYRQTISTGISRGVSRPALPTCTRRFRRHKDHSPDGALRLLWRASTTRSSAPRSSPVPRASSTWKASGADWPALFHDSGLSFRVSTTYVEQSGTFSLDVALPTFEKDDNAWITDAALDYRLPRRLGVVSVGVLNIADEFIDLSRLTRSIPALRRDASLSSRCASPFDPIADRDVVVVDVNKQSQTLDRKQSNDKESRNGHPPGDRSDISCSCWMCKCATDFRKRSSRTTVAENETVATDF